MNEEVEIELLRFGVGKEGVVEDVGAQFVQVDIVVSVILVFGMGVLEFVEGLVEGCWFELVLVENLIFGVDDG